MCGRYYADGQTAKEVERLVKRTGRGFSPRPAGDVYPSGLAEVIYADRGQLTAGSMKWGFGPYEKRGLLINARAESVTEKSAFRDSIRHRRCVIPARWFYEWNRAKEKASFLEPEGGTLYMAGCYREFDGQNCFVILTTCANPSVAGVHNRMPLLLESRELEEWIFDNEKLEYFLGKMPKGLERKMEYEQQTLVFPQ